MLENPMDSTANIATFNRCAPPKQRNRTHGRRKSGGGGRLERENIYACDGEKNQVAASRNFPVLDHRDTRSSSVSNQYPVTCLISLQGCCNSDAFQLLNNQRPTLYSGSATSAWGQFRLPHQIYQQPIVGVGPPSSQMDFLSELRQEMLNSTAGSDFNYRSHEI